MSDTTTQTEKRVRQMIGARTPAERLAMTCRMFSMARTLVLAGCQEENETDGPGHARERMFLRFYAGDFDESEQVKVRKHLRMTR